jgi:hypothetical protein
MPFLSFLHFPTLPASLLPSFSLSLLHRFFLKCSSEGCVCVFTCLGIWALCPVCTVLEAMFPGSRIIRLCPSANLTAHIPAGVQGCPAQPPSSSPADGPFAGRQLFPRSLGNTHSHPCYMSQPHPDREILMSVFLTMSPSVFGTF